MTNQDTTIDEFSKYIKVYEWMITGLKLTGSDLLVYAVIYSFTKENNKVGYFGGLDYLSKWCNISITGTKYAIERLINKKLIIKREHNKQDRLVKITYYLTTPIKKLKYVPITMASKFDKFSTKDCEALLLLQNLRNRGVGNDELHKITEVMGYADESYDLENLSLFATKFLELVHEKTNEEIHEIFNALLINLHKKSGERTLKNYLTTVSSLETNINENYNDKIEKSNTNVEIENLRDENSHESYPYIIINNNEIKNEIKRNENTKNLSNVKFFESGSSQNFDNETFSREENEESTKLGTRLIKLNTSNEENPLDKLPYSPEENEPKKKRQKRTSSEENSDEPKTVESLDLPTVGEQTEAERQAAKQQKEINLLKELVNDQKQKAEVTKATISSIKAITRSMIEDKDLQAALDRYAEGHFQSHFPIGLEAWKMKLRGLLSMESTVENLIRVVDEATQQGWKTFVCVKDLDKKKSNRRVFDNAGKDKPDIALHEMTVEQRKAFDATLAKDAEGNYLQF